MANFKIGFNYNLPSGFPITLKDIELLESVKDEAVWHIYSVLRHVYVGIKREDVPGIFISDAKPVRFFGTYSWEDVINEIKGINAKISHIGNCHVRDVAGALLEEIMGLVEKLLSHDMSTGAKAEYRTMLKNRLNRLKEELAEFDEDGLFKDAICNLLSHINNIKHKSNLLGTYSPMDNLITLYVNNILDYCVKNAKDIREGLLTYMEITIVHEMAHFYHFRCMGKDYAERMEYWSINTNPRGKRDSVIEGFARFIEGSWCKRKIAFIEAKDTSKGQYDRKDLYSEKLYHMENEKLYADYPGWPYAAGQVFLENPEAALEIFEKSITGLSTDPRARWREAYKMIVDTDANLKKKNKIGWWPKRPMR